MKLSFSLAKPSSRPDHAKTLDSFGGAATGDAAAPQPQFVTAFDPTETLASAATAATASHVIPSLPDTRPIKKMKNLLPPSDDPSAVPAVTHFVLDTSAADPAAAAIPYGLTVRSSNPNAHQESNGGRRSEPTGDSSAHKFREDMKGLKEHRGIQEFDDISIENFSAAYLAGYGWSKGSGIGPRSKEDAKVVEIERRAGTAGIGYTPSPGDPNFSRRRGIRTAPIGEKKKAPPLPSEKIVRVLSGRHAGMKGKVLRKSESSGLVLKLLRSGDEVRVGEDMVAELGSTEEERCLKKLKELEVHGREEKRSSRDNRREGKSSSRDNRKEERKSRDGEAKKAEGSHEKSVGNGGAQWLASNIRVRIISRDLKGGKLYKQKGKVVDVVSPTVCVVSMDGSGEMVQGVGQDMLETALPKRGGSVLILYGKYKGVFGSLVERDMEQETGVVRNADDHALINVGLDQIAEYVGDPSDLDY